MSKRKHDPKEEAEEAAKLAAKSESDSDVSPEEVCPPKKSKFDEFPEPSALELQAMDRAVEEQWIKATYDELVKQAKICDASVNKSWDDAHPRGPKHNDCLKNSGSGRKMPDGTPEPVQVRLGILKEACVNGKVPDNDHRKQQAVYNLGQDSPSDSVNKGAAIPDFIVFRNGSPETKNVIAVFDLKFPCPSERNKPGTWREGQLEKYRKRFPVEPRLVYPAIR